jgi:hypothetical protein
VHGLWREACFYTLGLEAVWGDHDKEGQYVVSLCVCVSERERERHGDRVRERNRKLGDREEL